MTEGAREAASGLVREDDLVDVAAGRRGARVEVLLRSAGLNLNWDR
jgi:hypothetical protein